MPSVYSRLVNWALLCILFAVAWHYVRIQLAQIEAAGQAIRQSQSAAPHIVNVGDDDLSEIGMDNPPAGNDDSDSTNVPPPAPPASANQDTSSENPPSPAAVVSHIGAGVGSHIKDFVQQHAPNKPGLLGGNNGPIAAPAKTGDHLTFPHSALICANQAALKQAVAAMESHNIAELRGLLVSRNPGAGQCNMAAPRQSYKVTQVSYNSAYPSIATLSLEADGDAPGDTLWSLNIGAAIRSQ